MPSRSLSVHDARRRLQVADTKGAHLLCAGVGSSTRAHRRTELASGTALPVPSASAAGGAPPHFFAVALHKLVVVFEIDRMEKRHHKLRDIAMPAQPQTMRIAHGRLYVGYISGFRVWDLVDNVQTGEWRCCRWRQK